MLQNCLVYKDGRYRLPGSSYISHVAAKDLDGLKPGKKSLGDKHFLDQLSRSSMSHKSLDNLNKSSHSKNRTNSSQKRSNHNRKTKKTSNNNSNSYNVFNPHI